MPEAWHRSIVDCLHVVHSTGWIGWLLFAGFYAVACLFFVPGSIMTFVAGGIYGFWGGLALALVGNGAGAALSLVITRYLLHGWAARYFARYPVLDSLETAVREDGWKIVCLAHLSPIMPFTLVNYVIGLTRIPARQFIPATILGGLPASCVYVYLGTLVGNLAALGPEMREHRPLEWFLQGIGLTATVLLTVYLTRRATQALKRRIPHPENWKVPAK